jgi:hypothetical protein
MSQKLSRHLKGRQISQVYPNKKIIRVAYQHGDVGLEWDRAVAERVETTSFSLTYFTPTFCTVGINFGSCMAKTRVEE